jgi:outer membrane lipoprotein-sorting protein
MTDANGPPTRDLLDQATRALRDAPAPPGPPAAVVASTVAALQQNATAPEIVQLHTRRMLMVRLFRYSSLATAALVLLTVGLSLFLLDRHAAVALGFGDVVQKVKDAKAVSFRCVQKLTPQSPVMEQRIYMQGDAMRMEIPGVQESFKADLPVIMAIVFDMKEMKALQLDFHGKLAKWLPVNEETAKQFANPVDRLRKLKDTDAKRLADEELNGRKTQVYSLSNANFFGGKGKVEEGESFNVWVDAETGLPVRIVVEGFNTNHKDKMNLTFDQFLWNQALPPEIFRLQVPEGFSVKD